MAILLMSSLGVMLYYARKSLKQEALQRVSQTLDCTVRHLDNVLLGAEQTVGNFYFLLWPYIDSKEKMLLYSRMIVESNSSIVGCAIAFERGFYEPGEAFMAYYHRSDDSTIVRSDDFAGGSYTEQPWFTEVMQTGKPGWMKPLTDDYGLPPAVADGQILGVAKTIDINDEATAVTTFSLPIYRMFSTKPVGVVGVDVSLKLLSRIVQSGSPSATSYCMLLDESGTFIVHPDSSRLFSHNVFKMYASNPSVSSAAKAMMSGSTGYMQFRKDDADYYVFYSPFRHSAVRGRAVSEQKWSMGMVYPKDAIFGDYNRLIYYVPGIAVMGLLLLFLLCRVIIHRQLQPLNMLTESAQRIAHGHYDETVPSSRQNDEIGRLQDNFSKMQQSLARHIAELEQLTRTLKERGERLRVAYERAKKADRMKTAFLHNMTNQMVGPAEAIENDVKELVKDAQAVTASTALADRIQQNGRTMAELLDNLLILSDEEKGKEAADD